VQFFLDKGSGIYPKAPQRYSPTSYSPPVKLVDELICESPHPFPTEPPVSRPYKMSLIEEAKRVAAEFEYTDDQVRKGVKHFIYQMSMSSLIHQGDPIIGGLQQG
jgi:hypothetical protein